jgi:hypothetical protein
MVAQYELALIYKYLFDNDNSFPKDKSKRLYMYWLNKSAENGYFFAKTDLSL